MNALLNTKPGSGRMDQSLQALDKVTHNLASGPATMVTVPGGFWVSYMDFFTQDNLIFVATMAVLSCQLLAYLYRFARWVKRKFFDGELESYE